MTFEENSKRLEEIVKKLEKGNISLEDGTKLFEEGVIIAKECYELINKNKGKIIEVKKQLDDIVDNND